MAPPRPCTYTDLVQHPLTLGFPSHTTWSSSWSWSSSGGTPGPVESLVLLAAAALVLTGCSTTASGEDASARLLVAVWTDLAIPEELERIEAVLAQEDQSVDDARPLDPRGQDQPVVILLSLGFLDRHHPLDLLVVGRAGPLLVVERRLILPRLPPGDSAVAVLLEARCAGRGCAEGWTCVGGRCERAEVSESVLATSVEELPADPLHSLVHGRRVRGCTSVATCEDGDPCTIDTCNRNLCNREEEPICERCTSDADCPTWGGSCLEARCHEYGICKWIPKRAGTRCDDDADPCTVQCCRDFGNCMGFDVCLDPISATGCDPDPP